MIDRYAALPDDQLRALLASERIGDTAKDSIRAALLARGVTNKGGGGAMGPPSPLSGLTRESRALRPTRLESEEQAAGVEFLRTCGWRVWRIGQRDARGTQDAGVPDVRAYHPAHGALWWEAKGKGGRQRPEQCEFQAAAEAAGEWYVLGGEQQLRAALAERFGGALPPAETARPQSRRGPSRRKRRRG